MAKSEKNDDKRYSFEFKFPDWSELEDIDATGSFWDSQELTNLNGTLIQTTLKLKEINKEITKYDRLKITAELRYKRKYRDIVLSTVAKTETQKKLQAEILCEDLEAKIIFYDEIIKELNRISSVLRTDLDTLKTIGHNLRQEMRL